MNQRGRGGPPRGPRGLFKGDLGVRGGAHSRTQQSSSNGFHTNGTGQSKDGLVSLCVRGWRNSKAAVSNDGGIGELRKFLERKVYRSGRPWAKIEEACKVLLDNVPSVVLTVLKLRTEGDAAIILVGEELAERMLHLNGFSFAGATLTVERGADDQRYDVRTSPFNQGSSGLSNRQPGFARGPQPDPSQTGPDTKAILTYVLGKRYDPHLKLLNLSALKQDPDLQQLGVFATAATESKFFPVLMKICDEVWDTPAKKTESVESVTVSNNQLITVLDITTLAVTFPSLRNLDLSNNLIPDFDALNYWRWKFRNLEHLVLSNNPITCVLDFQTTIMKWYPKLLQLNGQLVRTRKDIEEQQNPLPVMPPCFQDEADIAVKFVTDFFPLFDMDRDTALRNFYDANSSFSFSVNTHAKRVQNHEENHNSTWEQYIKKSRNLLKITHLPARQSRLFRGSQIKTAWDQMPRTKHPALSQYPSDWLVECHPLPGLPDPSGGPPGGVGGLLIMVHGHFEQMQPHTGQTTDRRSFDRTFVLGPGSGVGGIRVVSDILVLRSFGGSEAWSVSSTYRDLSSSSSSTAAAPVAPSISHPQVPAGSDIGQPAPGKPDIQVQNEILAVKLSFETGMRLEWAAKCLIENGWDMEKALVNFKELVAKNEVPPEAFLGVNG